MATDDDPIQELFRRAGVTGGDLSPREEFSLEDLGRVSRERMVARAAGTARILRSEGTLRLSGRGVKGHTADMESVAGVMVSWQRVVNSMGASSLGARNVRGRLPQDVMDKTRLMLSAAPGPGSLVLAMHAAADPMAELEPDGMTPIFEAEAERPLADLAVEQAAEALRLIDADSVSQPQFIANVSGRGPRVAMALRALLKGLADAEYDTDITWREPGRPSVRVVLSAGSASAGFRSIETQRLDTEELELVGELYTSSLGDRIELNTVIDGEPSRITIGRGSITDETIRNAPPGTRVKVVARVTGKVSPGGEPKFTYEGVSMVVQDL